ncbi:alpha/beta fold hydrolase [Altererythrobacter indicus]|uniref:Alpha/beta fold hydrolase n=1 Tax=Altericroceibacterium indicum TaxID=374177 RepID=A0A845AE68_9SPHN|nr:alpha/beta hydrolase [Altericroceibacterium indicum]MXP27095.1 alpha/beta fold hydrolase [Altericroceibacterium indicum]
MSYRLHRYRSADGRLELAARDYRADDNGAPALLLMHGLTRNSADFEPLAEHLAGAYRLIVPDQRGRGLSQWDSDASNYRPDIYVQDMLALLGELGIAQFGVIGTSMGGLMAMVMAAMQPERVSAMVLNDIGPVLEAEGIARIQGYVSPGKEMANWDEAAQRIAISNAPAFPHYGPGDWLAFAQRTCIQNPNGTISFAYDPAIAESMNGENPSTVPPDLWPLWDGLQSIPTLVIRGGISDLLSAQTVAEMGRRHSGPFDAVEIPHVGHAPILNEPAALDAILPFLAEQVH